jgi:DegV family protein with EDD domain
MTHEVALVADSSAGLPSVTVRGFPISIVPIGLHLGPDQFRDGVDIDAAEVYRAMERGVVVKSSAPSALEYLDAIEATGAGHVVVVTPATEFTFMYRNAVLAGELASRPVTVVDSRSATAGHGMVLLAAAEVAAAGAPAEEVVAVAEDAAARTELVGCLETLDFLRSSGRVPALALGLATQLGVRPVFRFQQGVAERVGLPRSWEAALTRVLREWRSGGGAEAGRCAVFHAGRPEGAASLAARLGGSSFTTEFSAAMGIHTGPGVVGLAWVRAPA